MANDYSTLKADIAKWVGNQVDADTINRLVSLAEDDIADDIDVQDQEVTVALDTSTSPTTVPSDFLYGRAIYLDLTEGRQRVDYLSPSAYWAKDPNDLNTNPTFPRWFTVEGRAIVWTPVPTDTVNANLLYFARYTRLANDTDTNWVLENKYGAYLYGSLVHSAPYIGNDNRLPMWAAMYDNAVDKVNQTARRGRFPRGQKTATARSVAIR